jgi:hypothetical protein
MPRCPRAIHSSRPHAEEHRGAKRDICSSRRRRRGRPHPSRRAHTRSNLRTRLRIRAPQDEDGDHVQVLFTFQTAHLVPAARFCARVLHFGFAHPGEGWRSAERRTDACEASVGPALSGQARHLARRLASPYGGRPPPGAHTVAVLGFGAALPLTGIAAGSVTANSHIRVVVPGGGPLPPGAAVANRRRGTPRLAPPSGCLRTTPLEEQGWEDSYYTSQNAVNRKIRCVATKIFPARQTEASEASKAETPST